MQIKLNKSKDIKRLTAIPTARVAVSAAEYEGVRQVNVHLSAEDCYKIPYVVASLRLSPTEARAVAAQFLEMADRADKL